MSMQKLYQSVVQLQASSRVSDLHFTNRMQIWQNMFFFDMLSWRKSPIRSRRKELRMDQLQVREAHLSSDKVSADQTSDNINAKDNTVSPNWHLWRSRHLEKATRCCQATRLISLVRSAWFRPILDWLWRKSKSDWFRRSHLTSDKVNADQDIGEGQCWG